MGSVGLNADVSGIIKLKESKNDYNKLTLDYKGRDLGRLELNLKRNDNQTFSVMQFLKKILIIQYQIFYLKQIFY